MKNISSARIEAERIATAFRVAPRSDEHAHCSIREAVGRMGGEAAILYGYWLAIPARQRWKKHDTALDVASAIDRHAATL